MATITIYGYVFNGKKWKYKQKSISTELDYDNAKQYAKVMFKRLIKDRSISLEGISISRMHDSEITSEELHKNMVYSERKKGNRTYRTNEETLGSLSSYIIYYSK